MADLRSRSSRTCARKPRGRAVGGGLDLEPAGRRRSRPAARRHRRRQPWRARTAGRPASRRHLRRRRCPRRVNGSGGCGHGRPPGRRRRWPIRRRIPSRSPGSSRALLGGACAAVGLPAGDDRVAHLGQRAQRCRAITASTRTTKKPPSAVSVSRPSSPSARSFEGHLQEPAPTATPATAFRLRRPLAGDGVGPHGRGWLRARAASRGWRRRPGRRRPRSGPRRRGRSRARSRASSSRISSRTSSKRPRAARLDGRGRTEMPAERALDRRADLLPRPARRRRPASSSVGPSSRVTCPGRSAASPETSSRASAKAAPLGDQRWTACWRRLVVEQACSIVPALRHTNSAGGFRTPSRSSVLVDGDLGTVLGRRPRQMVRAYNSGAMNWSWLVVVIGLKRRFRPGRRPRLGRRRGTTRRRRPAAPPISRTGSSTAARRRQPPARTPRAAGRAWSPAQVGPRTALAQTVAARICSKAGGRTRRRSLRKAGLRADPLARPGRR